MPYLPRNPLVYPAGYVPGFDPTHFIARGMSPNYGFAGIAMSGGIMDLATGKKGTLVGAPTRQITGIIGDAVNFTDGTNQGLSYSGYRAVASDATFGAIIKVDAFGGGNNNGVIWTSSNSANGWLLFIDGGNFFSLYNGVAGALTSTLDITAGVPYFVAVSVNTTTAHYLMMDMRSGVISTSTVAGAAPTTANGTYLVGNYDTTNALGGQMAAIMFAPLFNTLPTLLAWARDPWAFWYPGAAGDYWEYPRVAPAAAVGGRIWQLAGSGGGLIGEPRGLVG